VYNISGQAMEKYYIAGTTFICFICNVPPYTSGNLGHVLNPTKVCESCINSHLTFMQMGRCNPHLLVRQCCGRVTRLPCHLSPSHGLCPPCRNTLPITNYFISLLPHILSPVYSCTHYFPPFTLPDLLCSCAIASELVPLLS
jgi:hypothetical protein